MARGERAQGTLIGFTFLLAFLVILVSLYQTQAVPAQNKEVEFNHHRDIQRDLIELRNALLTARSTGASQYVDLNLVVAYDERILGRNPPPPHGALRTSEPHPIRVQEDGAFVGPSICPGDSQPTTRFLTYEPHYNFYTDAPRVIVENSVLYLETEDGRRILKTNQQIIEGDRITLAPLGTEFHRTSSDAIPIEVIPGTLRTRDVTDATITFPTRLTEAQWEQLLDGEITPAAVSVANGNVSIETSGEIRVTCSPVGLDNAPPGGPRAGGGVAINPVAPGDVQLVDARTRQADNRVDVDFSNRNTARATNITDARLTFFFNRQDTGGAIGDVQIKDNITGPTSATLVILGESRPLDPEIRLPADETTTIYLQFTGTERIEQGDFMVLDITFTSGQTGTYFIAPRTVSP